MYKNLISVALLLITTSFATSQAQEVYWKKQVVSVPVNASANKSVFNQMFQRVVIQHNYYECGYYQDPIVEIRTGICYDTVCQGGAGKSPAWDAFYSAKKEEKASKLAAAIKGVGKVSAEALVAGGYFNSKPKSWEAFKGQIKAAAQAGAITEQVKTLVLSNYRNDNIANLGYNGGCHSTEYACQEPVVVQDGFYIPKTCDNPIEQVIENKPMSFQFQVSGSVLLPTESENLKFNLSGDLAEVTMASAYYNSYAFQVVSNNGQSAAIIVTGTGRKQVSLPSNAIQSVGLVPTGAKSATLQISVSAAALPVSNAETLAINYEIKSCKIGLFGSCGLGWNKKETLTSSLVNGITSIPVTTDLVSKKGLKMEVTIKVYKQNSVYHTANPISKSTKTIVLK